MLGRHHYVDVAGVRVHYVEEGGGVPLLLVHGLGASLVAWGENIGPLSERFRVIALDLPGHGDSDPFDESLEYNHHTGAWFLSAFLDAVGVERAVLVGNSAGGLLCAQTAISYPERVLALVLVDSAGLGREVRWFLRLASLPLIGELLETPNVRNPRNMARALFHSPDKVMRDDIARELMRARNSPQAKRTVLRAIRATINLLGLKRDVIVLDELRRLRVPLMVVWGEEDQIIPVSHARRAMRELPDARVVVIPRCGHWPQMECAQVFNDLLVSFLEAHLQGVRSGERHQGAGRQPGLG